MKQENREPVPPDSVIPAIENKTFTTSPYISKLSNKLGEKNKNIISLFLSKLNKKLTFLQLRKR
jgi:hypothetical protein